MSQRYLTKRRFTILANSLESAQRQAALTGDEIDPSIAPYEASRRIGNSFKIGGVEMKAMQMFQSRGFKVAAYTQDQADIITGAMSESERAKYLKPAGSAPNEQTTDSAESIYSRRAEIYAAAGQSGGARRDSASQPAPALTPEASGDVYAFRAAVYQAAGQAGR